MNRQRNEEYDTAPTQFLITDIYALMFQFGCFGVLFFWLLKDESIATRAIIPFLAWFPITVIWYAIIRGLNADGLASRAKRAFWLIFTPYMSAILFAGFGLIFQFFGR